MRRLPAAITGAVFTLSIAACGVDANHDAADTKGEDRGVEVMDLSSLVRLRATDPLLQPLMPWPREAEDAVAAVRDDWEVSAWRAPGGESWAEIDLVPFAGGVVTLEELALSFDGPPPDSLVLYHAAACGDGAGTRLPWGDPTVPLDLSGLRAGCLRLAASSEAPFVLSDLRLVVRDVTITLPQPRPVPTPRGELRHVDSGVVEGFYGVPWSWRERRNMLRHLAHLGLGVYLYGPKHDPRHRAEWRAPYTPEEMEEFSRLAALGASLGVRVFFGISPFIDWDSDGQKSYECLLGKLLEFQAVGFQAFVLLADDIEFEVAAPVDGAMGATHVAVANQLLADLRGDDPDVELWFVPTVYSDERIDQWTGGINYLAALADLDPVIRVMWTGPGTSNDTLRADDFDRFVQVVGRKPVLWENHWANDGGDGFTGRLPLGPYSGRDASVPDALRGIVANPLIQGATSRLVMTTLARNLDAPDASPGEARREAAATAELPFTVGAAANSERDTALVGRIQALFDQDERGPPGWQEMEQAIEALEAALLPSGSLPADEAGALLSLFAGLMTLPAEVARSGLDPDLDDELVYPLRKARLVGEAGLLGLLALGDRLAGAAASPHWAGAQAAHEAALFCRFVFSEGHVSGLLDAIAGLEPIDLGFVAPAVGEPLPPCRAGQEFTWTPFVTCPHQELFGLPGATLDEAGVRWTPASPGRYTVVVVCRTGQGWGARTEDISCGP
ncbi:MAG: beta-N-acetylglucosaminidase domain-containing protein [Pseudomonadota bacterium]